MRIYNKQVETSHYVSKSYDSLERFISYWNQKKVILTYTEKLKSPKVLEIGKGNGFLDMYLKNEGVNISTFDIDSSLNPDYIGDIMTIDEIVKKEFDIVCCFEVLEHIEFNDLDMVLQKLNKITKDYLILSIPHIYLFITLWFNFPKIRPKNIHISIPFKKSHKFDGEHYWELGKRKYNKKSFEKILLKYFSIVDTFCHPLDPIHRFYILKK